MTPEREKYDSLVEEYLNLPVNNEITTKELEEKIKSLCEKTNNKAKIKIKQLEKKIAVSDVGYFAYTDALSSIHNVELPEIYYLYRDLMLSRRVIMTDQEFIILE